jgi:cytochrome bd-type quinol oxidase subunit 2
MNAIIRWLSRVFVWAAGTLLVWIRIRDPYSGDTFSSPVWILLVVSVVTLPAAAVQFYRDDDPRSRRIWLLMLAILGVLLVAAILMKPVR